MSLSLRPVWLFPLALILTGAACPAKQVSPAAGEPGTPSGNAGSGGSVTPPGGGAPPPRDPDPSQACAEEAHRAEMVPLDLMMVVDSSGSMNEFAGRKTKWELATTALSAFVRDPRYAGLGIGLQFFPLGYPKACTTDADCISFATTSNGSLCQQVTHFCVGPEGLVPGVGSLLCEPQSPAGSFRPGYPDCPTGTTCLPIGNCAGSGARCANIGQACPLSGGMCLAEKACWETIPRPECEIARYEKPTVPIDTLPMSEMALTAALRAWSPMGGTPMGPAVRGAISYLRTRLAANPGRKAALVLVGDGLPDGCARVAEGEPGMNDIPAIATILGDAFMASPSIPTYVIGVFALGDLVLSGEEMDRLAMAGGTNQAYVLNAAATPAPRARRTSPTWSAPTAATPCAAAGITTSSPPGARPSAYRSARPPAAASRPRRTPEWICCSAVRA
jgi:hypothetical protein